MKIIVRSCGGLGNQMFQYAIGRAIALETEGEVLVDVSSFEREKRKFSLNDFCLIDKIHVFSYKSWEVLAAIKVIKRLRKWGIGRNKIIFGNIIMETFPPSYFDFNFSVLREKRCLFLEGFWQSEQYFARHREAILNDFTLNSFSSVAEQWDETIRSKGYSAVGLHIRRGDYVSEPSANRVHGVLSIGYYKNADKLLHGLGIKPTYFIFTDDVEWARENLSFSSDVFFVSETGCRDVEEMILMSRCSHAIIANSSFSWWSAWMNKNKDKVVVAPAFWFRNMASDHIVPKEWYRI